MLNQKNQDIFFVLKKTPQAKNDSFLSSCAFNVEEKKVTIVISLNRFVKKNAQCTFFFKIQALLISKTNIKLVC